MVDAAAWDFKVKDSDRPLRALRASGTLYAGNPVTLTKHTYYTFALAGDSPYSLTRVTTTPTGGFTTFNSAFNASAAIDPADRVDPGAHARSRRLARHAAQREARQSLQPAVLASIATTEL